MDYLAQQNRPARKIAVIAAVAVIHAGLLVGFLSWRGYGHPLDMLIKVKIVPPDPVPPARPPHKHG
jgi:hypothetical protein